RELYAVLRKAPHHPGALHYLIHALDTPGLAPKAKPYLPALKNAAPDLPHLVHMPSHISLRLGQWDESIRFNHEAYFVSSRGSDFHAVSYLHYSYLQKGPTPKYRRLVGDALSDFIKTMGTSTPESDPGTYLTLAEVKARQALEWDDWSLIDDKLPPRIAY